MGLKRLTVEVDAKYIKGMINNPDIQPNATINRWIAAILTFDFKLVHVAGSKHSGADGLSRRPAAEEDEQEDDDVDEWIDRANAFMLGVGDNEIKREWRWTGDGWRQYEQGRRYSEPRPMDEDWGYGDDSEAADLWDEPGEWREVEYLGEDGSEGLEVMAFEEQKEVEIPRSESAKERDRRVGEIKEYLETMERPAAWTTMTARQVAKMVGKYVIYEGSLWRKRREKPFQKVPAAERRYGLLKKAHDDLGHKGVFAVKARLQDRFWWPKMDGDIQWYIKTCHQCQTRQMHKYRVTPTVQPPASLFMKVYVDVMHMPKANGYTYIIQARCSLTSYPEFRMLRNESAKGIAAFLFEQILCRWGLIHSIVSDNGSSTVAAIKHLADHYHFHHIPISAYNSRADGLVERRHRDVREAIMKTAEGIESKWTEVTHAVFWAERITIQKATGFSPYYMAHGVEPLLPFDLTEATYMAPAMDAPITTSDLIAIRGRQLMKRAKDLAMAKQRVIAARFESIKQFEKQHSAVIKNFVFSPGDLVLIRNTRVEAEASRKLKPRYLGPMAVVRKTRGGAYILAELDNAVSQTRYAAFRVIPYHARSRLAVPVTQLVEMEGSMDSGDEDGGDLDEGGEAADEAAE